MNTNKRADRPRQQGGECRERAGLADYRCYVIEADDHIRQAAVIVQCNTDAEALIEARRLLGDQAGIEVWASDRRVAMLHPRSSSDRS